MRVRIDAQHTADIEGLLVSAPVKIETPRMGVDFDDNIVLGAGPQHLLDVDFVPRSPLKLPPGHVAYDGVVRMRDGPKEALRLRLAVQFEATVDAGDHEVKALQHVVRIVQRTVGQDVRFDAFENPEVLPEALVQAVSLQMLFSDLLD